MSGKADNLAAIAERLTDALKADIAALEQGSPRDMRSISPEMQQLAMLFARETAAFDAGAARTAPDAARTKLIDAARRFRETLALQMRMVSRTRTISEGMIHAIAEDVARRKSAMRPYAPMTPRPRSPGAMVFNSMA